MEKISRKKRKEWCQINTNIMHFLKIPKKSSFPKIWKIFKKKIFFSNFRTQFSLKIPEISQNFRAKRDFSKILTLMSLQMAPKYWLQDIRPEEHFFGWNFFQFSRIFSIFSQKDVRKSGLARMLEYLEWAKSGSGIRVKKIQNFRKNR